MATDSLGIGDLVFAEMVECVPRRTCVEQMIPGELAIRDAILAVEALEANPRLTEVAALLEEAKDKLSDWVDSK